ncbi:unnamed protein product [Effrenium voratum]|nr:unnamed protein product [Effrenium voratum]
MAMRLAAIALLMQSATGAICGNWNTTQCEMMNDGGCDCELLAGGTCAKSANCSGVGITNVGFPHQDEEMNVWVKAVMGVEPPAEKVAGYRLTAFYQSETLEPRERRKSAPQAEQFVKVVLLAVVDGADVAVGEATIPIADPMAGQMTSWRIMRDFEERGEVELQIFLPGDDLGSLVETSQAQKSTVMETYDLAAKYAAVASKSVVESTVELSSKQESVDSMVPEPHSEVSDPTPVDKPSFQVGERVQVLSRSSGQWVISTIVHVDSAKSEVIVQHGDLRKVINLRAPNLSEYFRPLGAKESPSHNGLTLGTSVEVYSASASRWIVGEIARLDLARQEATVEYESRVKTVNLTAPDLHSYFRAREPLGFGLPQTPHARPAAPAPAPPAPGPAAPAAAPPAQQFGVPGMYPVYGPGYGLPNQAPMAQGLTVPVGVLLFGPPGCGKTLLAKATANQSGANFIAVKGPELLNKYVGESERAVRLVFQRARSSSPCVIFFDELDALVPRRSSEGTGSSERVVNQMLTEMDGVQSRSQVYVIAATNRPDIVDPAMLRPGRLDRLLYVPLPSAAGRLEILQTHMRKLPLAADVDLPSLAKAADGFSGADLASLAREAAMLAIRKAASPCLEAADGQESLAAAAGVQDTWDACCCPGFWLTPLTRFWGNAAVD